MFIPLLSHNMPQPAKALARSRRVAPTMAHLGTRLAGGDTQFGEGFTIADAYLVTMLNWCRLVGIELAGYEKIAADHTTCLTRPAVAQAMAAEWAEYQQREA